MTQQNQFANIVSQLLGAMAQPSPQAASHDTATNSHSPVNSANSQFGAMLNGLLSNPSMINGLLNPQSAASYNMPPISPAPTAIPGATMNSPIPPSQMGGLYHMTNMTNSSSKLTPEQKFMRNHEAFLKAELFIDDDFAQLNKLRKQIENDEKVLNSCTSGMRAALDELDIDSTGTVAEMYKKYSERSKKDVNKMSDIDELRKQVAELAEELKKKTSTFNPDKEKEKDKDNL
ncbi:MAG: hypothetical protein Faunusvirus7_9 [Faunusvirus sp.]|jgi:hypothetical protein|uniref:Uncharacterized protein n=1 Tax=Faunusvirus sp. TaxID=2487766 RepID=A0A3G4ZZ30_9VIRU|nr:MAG: hypothetical protein Faunusvirus7_9 [Faunusvirus sp.]